MLGNKKKHETFHFEYMLCCLANMQAKDIIQLSTRKLQKKSSSFDARKLKKDKGTLST